MDHLRQGGRALPLVLGAIAIAAVAFLLIADPFAGGGADANDPNGAGGGTDLLGAEGAGDKPEAEGNGAATLASRYGAGDLGAIKLRLLRVGSRNPVAGQQVELLSRRGTEVAATPSDVQGVVLFPQVRPGRGYSLHVEGEGFSEVLLRGVSVHPRATTDLGDLILGKDVVLRGRVVDSTGRPVPGTAVSVHTIQRRLATKGMLVYLAEQASTVPLPLKSVDSDEAGYFAFSALDDGSYSLVARRNGFASKHESDVIVAAERGAGVLTVVLGEPGRVSGKVTDADGKPIADAQVIAIRDERRMMMSNAIQREVALTAEDGTYVIDTLTAEQSYRFGVVAKGYAPVYEVRGTRISEKEQERNWQLEKGGDLEGVITDDSSGKPIEGARIAVYVGPMGWGGRAPEGAKAAADVRRTNEKGYFKFEAVTPGQVSSAVVQAPGYVTASFSQWPPPGNAWADVKAGECTTVKASLKRGGTIKGVVTRKEDGQPVQGAEVTLMQTGWMAMASMWLGTPNAISGADGSFELVGVTPGTYRLLAVAEGYSPAGGEEGVEIEMPEGGGTQTKSLELIAAGVVTGVVTDPDGEPLAGIRVRIRAGPQENANGGNGGRRGGRRGMNMARRMLSGGQSPADLTDEEGRYRLKGVGSDTPWVVYGESDEYVGGESKPLKVAAGETKEADFQMLPGGALRGRVLDENGRWLPGARVQVGHLTDEMAREANLNSWTARRALGSNVYTSDSEGRFFAPNLTPGRQLVRVEKNGYIVFFKRNVTIKPGETFDNYTAALTKGETIEGTVRGADGQILRGAMVAVTTQANPGEDAPADAEPSEDIEPSMWGRTDDKGRYKIENVKPGTYNVVIWFAPGHKGWGRDRDDAAIHRDVRIPAPEQDFKLTKAEPRDPMGGGGGRRGGR